MPRYIDADALHKKFLHLYDVDKKATGANAYDLCAMLTEDAPTVDAVEVVRCKDCKSYCEATDFTPAYCTVCGEQKTDEDFCSWGERKKENAAD